MMTLERVDGAANAGRAPVENMGVDHRRLHIAMTQKLLDCSDVIIPFQQVSCEGMPESMARSSLPFPFPADVQPHGLFDGKIEPSQ